MGHLLPSGVGGVLFVVVPDYLKERAFFWDIDYTHNFVTTERRVRQLLYEALLHESNVARNDPDPVVGHRLIAYDAGLPKSLIRFST